MSLDSFINNIVDEIKAPNKGDLLNEAEKLELEINKKNPLKLALKKLQSQIENNEWVKERLINENQLETLENINNKILEIEKKDITKTTKKEINKLLNSIEGQINLKANLITDELNSINKIVNNENNRLKDNIDIIQTKTIRDKVEESIDITWILESWINQQYQDFFDIATVVYIDLIEKKYNKKINNTTNEKLINYKWLHLDKNEAITFLNNLDKKIKSKGLYINFDFEIKLHKFWWIRIMKSKDYYEIKNEEKRKKDLEEKRKEEIRKRKEEKEKIAEKKLHREIQIEEYIVNEAADLIIKYEWFLKKSKWDNIQYTRGYWTKAPWKNKYINKNDAKKELLKDVEKVKKYLEKYFPNINTNQKISLISFFYNNWTSSRWKENLIWRLKNMNKEIKWIWKIKPESISNIMLKFKKSWWKVLKWLENRRKDEVIKFLQEDKIALNKKYS